MPRKKTYCIVSAPEVMEKLRALAKEENRTLSNAVETVIIKYLKDMEK